MFRFIPDHVGGVGTKRKQSQRTCQTCKKRHKRCSHVEVGNGVRDDVSSSTTPASGVVPEENPQEDRPSPGSGPGPEEPSRLRVPQSTGTGTGHESFSPGSARDTRPRPTETYLRFVGDLSPEASFLSSQRRGAESLRPSRHAEVGVWQRPEEHEGPLSQREEGPQDASHQGLKPLGLTSLRTMSSQLRRECLSILPPEYELGLITRLYYAKVDPLFPILRTEALDSQETSSSDIVALKQCICLVGALDPKMRKHLRLPHTERILSPVEFRECIFAALKQSVDLGFIRNEMVLLQVCALMAFYTDRVNCSEVSASYVSQAVHHSQGLGLHLGWPDDGSSRSEKSKRIFWCIWVLDRLNAANNGRPILMHKQDMDRSLLETYAEQTAPFRLLIGITQLLDDIISRYRPHSTSNEDGMVDGDISFEKLVRNNKAENVSGPLLATLEMFYLAIIILKYRPKDQSHQAPSSDFQMFAATGIISIVTEDFKSTITFWPIVPYAVSLATSIAYKSLRNSTLAHHRKRAYSLFHGSCEALDELGRAFSSARTIARLATDTMQEVERVAAGRSKARQTGWTQASRHGTNTPQTRRAAREENRPFEAPAELHPEPATFDSGILSTDSYQFFDDLIGDTGIFNDLDPNFDLERIDHLFTANLDPTQPLRSQDWMGYPGYPG